MGSRMRSDPETVPREIALVQHFREHLAALSDPKLLDLLTIACVDSITNKDVRRVLRLRRGQAWTNLSALVNVGMLEKRGQYYRASPYARHLITALYITFSSVLEGKMPEVRKNDSLPQVLRIASDGLESLYDRGRMAPDEYKRSKSLLKQVAASLEERPPGTDR